MKGKNQIIFCLINFLIIGNVLGGNALGQEKGNWDSSIGIGLLQITTSTLDLTYEFSNNPRYSMIVNPGYTMNYVQSLDFIGFFLSPHSKCGNDGYKMYNQSGGFVKLGMKYNFRNSFEKTNYFYLGAFLTNSLIYEKAEYENWDIPNSDAEFLSHKVFVSGLTGAVGYNFRFSEKFNSDVGVHISKPSKSYGDLYGYTNYIPGMGYMETCGKGGIFPMLIFTLKYGL